MCIVNVREMTHCKAKPVHKFQEILLCEAGRQRGNIPCSDDKLQQYESEVMKTKTRIHCSICHGIVYIGPGIVCDLSDSPRGAVVHESQAQLGNTTSAG